MDEHVTTAQLKADLASVLRDAEVLIKASADQGDAKMTEDYARNLTCLIADIRAEFKGYKDDSNFESDED